MNKRLNIWLAYVSYPVTTAVYIERALREKYNVITIGPRISDSLIELWDLKNLKVPVKDHDIPTVNTPDLAEIVAKVPRGLYPDIFLWIESINGYEPQNIKKLDCPTACLLIDSHLSLEKHIPWAKEFGQTFIVHKQFLQDFKNNGISQVNWLPVGCDKEVHSTNNKSKLYNVGFVGSLAGDTGVRRVNLLNKIHSEVPVSYKRCFWTEMSEFLGSSRIVFNNAILNDLNMRLFETMSVGSFLLTDMAKDSGQQEMFVDGEDYIIYNDENILDKVKYYLANESERERIALNGQKIVHKAHTYSHRSEEMLKVILGEKSSTPSAEEWRERSVSREIINIPKELKPAADNSPKENIRSFVIPVLDMSPASPYNITTLLDDLSGIPGDVIVIFNSVDMAEKLKSHPRINYYATMKKNVGVSRAWNIGLNISHTPVTFIMNADLHVKPDTIINMEKYLNSLPEAAIVGPQGSFYNFEAAKDIAYFEKNSFSNPMAVDAVSGFLFAVKTEMFNCGLLKFDNQYTPCYFEEWDLGLQIKRAGLKSYIVPVNGFEHEWSGSIRALRKINYLGKEETAGEILNRNRELFWNKWRGISFLEQGNDTLLKSLWTEAILQATENLISSGNPEEAEKVLKQSIEATPGQIEFLAALIKILYKQNRFEEALVYLNKASEINPDYKLSLGVNTNEPEIIEGQNEEYYENPRPDIQQLVDSNPRRILDVGCGSGRMAYELKNKLNAEVWGIEINRSAAEAAGQRLDNVIWGKIEEVIPSLPDNYFDTIIFADVLEHLIDPYTVLERIKDKLSASGNVIASIPNIRFWTIIKDLIEGSWEYRDSGILDKTHLRFFTFSSIIKMFHEAGYKVDKTHANQKDVDIPSEIINCLRHSGVNPVNLEQEAKCFQFIITASRAARQ